MDDYTRKRLIEIAFYNIYTHMTAVVADTYLEMYLQTLCRIFEIDYTSITIIQNMYMRKLKPNKRDMSLFAILVDMPYKRIPVDYRTLRKYKKEYEMEGRPAMFPKLRNEALREDVTKFVKHYLAFYNDDLEYMRNIKLESDLDAS